MKHSKEFEQFLSEDLSLHSSVDWMNKGDNIRRGMIPPTVQKEFLETVEKEYLELDAPDIHPSERIEYLVARLYPLACIPEKTASKTHVHGTLVNLIAHMGNEIIAWKEQSYLNINLPLVASCVSYKKYKDVPMMERNLSVQELLTIQAFPHMADEPITNEKVEAVDIQRFVETYEPGYFGIGVNESHSFLPIHLKAYLTAMEYAKEPVDPKHAMIILNRLIFGGETVRPPTETLPVTQALSDILLDYIATKTPAQNLRNIFEIEAPLEEYKYIEPRLNVYQKMKKLIGGGTHHKGPNDNGNGNNTNNGRGPRE